jgi:small neutral amino acid transporter SnatA (MarC family)
MVKQITSKENKKAIKKAAIEMLILMTVFYVAAYIFIKFVLWVWN